MLKILCTNSSQSACVTADSPASSAAEDIVGQLATKINSNTNNPSILRFLCLMESNYHNIIHYNILDH